MPRPSRWLLLLVSAAALCAAGPAEDRLARFNKVKFGMFIHWGPYSLASVEASWPIMVPGSWGISEPDYRALAARFKPAKFDPVSWVRLARAAGQRYMVLTSKHHDGFCMFDSAYTSYKVTQNGGKDLVAQLAAACKAEKMPFGLYYSPPDMNHAGFRDTSRPARENWQGQPDRPEWPLYLDYMEMQLRELLHRYGDLWVLWFDGLGNQQKYDPRRFHNLIRETQPGALINNRLGLDGDYDTPEQFVPGFVPTRSSKVELKGLEAGEKNRPDLAAKVPDPSDFRPWESCMTINDTWAYNKNDRKFKSTEELVRTLIEVASKGGNLLLNVGPDPDGVIQPEFEERLRGIGKWLEVNGEAIYGTTYGLVQGAPGLRFTTKGKMLYLHVLDWPANGRIFVPRLPARVESVLMLETGRPLEYAQKGDLAEIRVPPAAPDPVATVVAIKLK